MGYDEESCACNIVHKKSVECVKQKMPAEEELYDLAEFFKVFGDSTRMRIMSALRIGELCVCDLAFLLNMTKSAVSHQLRILRQTKLVKSRRSGKEVYYTLADAHISEILDVGLEHLEE